MKKHGDTAGLGQAKSLELLCMQEHLVSACSSGKEATRCGRDGVRPDWNGNLSTTQGFFCLRYFVSNRWSFTGKNEQKYLFLVMFEDANELKMKKTTSEKERREGKQNGEEQKMRKCGTYGT